MAHEHDNRPLIAALVISTALHSVALLGDRLHLHPEAAKVYVIQATLQRLPPQTPTASEVAAPSEPAAKPPRVAKHAAAEGKEHSSPNRAHETSRNPEAAKAPQAPPKKVEPEAASEAIAISDPGAPEYPDEAIRRKLESCVLAAVQVSASGTVESVRILHADVPGVFDRSVIDAYSQARYQPARRGGEAVPSRVLAVASFELAPGRPRHCAGRYAAAARRILALPAGSPIDPALVQQMVDAGR